MWWEKKSLRSHAISNSVMFARTKVLGRSVDPVLNPPVFTASPLYHVHVFEPRLS